MKVKDAIELLQGLDNPDEEIIFAYWNNEDQFSHLDDKEWEDLCAIEDEINWSFAWESIQFVVDNHLEETEETEEVEDV